MDLCAVLKHLHAIDYAVGTVGLRREAGPSPSAGRLPLRAFEGSKMIGVIGVEQAGPSRRAALRRLRELRGWGQDRRPRGYPLDQSRSGEGAEKERSPLGR